VHRIFNLCVKYCGGKIPDVSHDPKFPPPFDLRLLQEETHAALNSCLINVALFKAMEAARSTNRFLYIDLLNLLLYNLLSTNFLLTLFFFLYQILK